MKENRIGILMTTNPILSSSPILIIQSRTLTLLFKVGHLALDPLGLRVVNTYRIGGMNCPRRTAAAGEIELPHPTGMPHPSISGNKWADLFHAGWNPASVSRITRESIKAPNLLNSRGEKSRVEIPISGISNPILSNLYALDRSRSNAGVVE